jgi:cytochrome c oxidase subunit 2
MSSILPPAQRIWWKQPLDRVEGTWIAIALIWCLIMFAMMPYWHIAGKQNLSNEAYRTTPEAFAAKAQTMIDKYTVRTETEQQIPVVHPPAGNGIRCSNSNRAGRIGCICPRWTGSTVSRCSRSTSIPR